MTFEIVLNGTDTNPFLAYGVRQNPFSQIADARYSAYMLHLQHLGGDPIPDSDYIRRHLHGYSAEFVELCCQQFRKGEMVRFTVTFDG